MSGFLNSPWFHTLFGILVGVVAGMYINHVYARAYDRKAQINAAIVRLKVCCSARRNSHPERPLDGLDATAHWFHCTAEAMQLEGYGEAHDLLMRIKSQLEIWASKPDLDKCPELDARETQKAKWYSELREIVPHLARR